MRVGLAFTAFAVLAAAAPAFALSTGATGGVPAERGEAYRVTDPPPPPVHRRVVMISDSALAGIRWTGNLGLLTGAPWDPHLESCRRLVATSCRGREGYRPATVVDEIDAHAATHGPTHPSDILVVATGYNDWEGRFRDDFRAVVDAARRAGFLRIVWLTYRDETSYRLPGGGQQLFASYTAMNAILFEELATGRYPDVNVWDYRAVTAGRPDWFTSDGVHLSPAGAEAIARWLSSHFGEDSPPWFNA